MTRNQWLIIAALGVMVVCVYCVGMFFVAQQILGQDARVALAPTPTATFTPVPTWTPTNVPSPRPSATLVIQLPVRATPTARVIGTQTASAGAIQKAFEKSVALNAYRMEIEMKAKGDLGNLPGGVNPNQEFVLLGMSGAVNGKDTHFVIKGILGAFFGGDANKGFEMMSVGGKTYVHGPLAMLGAPEDKWYIGDSSFKSSFSDPNQMVKPNENMDLNGFRKTGSETLDGQRCDVYTADKNSSLELFRSLNTSGAPNQDALGALDNAETKIWICDDGYFHQLAMNMEGHSQSNPAQKTAIQLKMRVFDLNANIKITAPANAAPMQAPAFFFGTPTATPTRR
jgi:hypothetical protein